MQRTGDLKMQKTGDLIPPFFVQTDYPSININNPNVFEDTESVEEDEPYIHLTYYPSGNLESKTYFMDEDHNTIHRKDGPAVTFYFDCSPPKVQHERWVRVHDMHRDMNEGAAFVNFDENGNSIYEEFWENDRRYKNYGRPLATKIFEPTFVAKK